MIKISERLFYNQNTGLFFNHKGKAVGSKVKKRGWKEYLKVYLNGKYHYAQRLAWFAVHDKWPENEIDHIDGDSMNNKIGNLRDVTRQENSLNRSCYSASRSGVCGVNWHAPCGKWRARFKLKGKEFYLGVFANKKDAEKAVLKARKSHGFHCNHGSAGWRPTGNTDA